MWVADFQGKQNPSRGWELQKLLGEVTLRPVLVDLGGNSQRTACEGGGQQNELGGDVWVAHLRNRLQTNTWTRVFI